MTAIKLLNLLAISSLAIIASTFGTTPVNALSNGHDLGARHHARGHDAVAKRKRGSKSCRQRPTQAAAASSSSSASSTSTPKPTPTTNKAAAAPTSSQATGGNNGGGNSGSGAFDDLSVKGVAWANGGTDGLSQYRVQGKKQPLYTWDSAFPSGLDQMGFVPAPMLWGGTQDMIDKFEKLVQPGYANIALGFNEVNEPKQANIDPKTAADLWIKHMNPRSAMGYKLGAPCSSGNPNGIPWMQQFFKECNGKCIVDFMTVHYYDTSIEGFKNWVTQWHTEFDNRDVWITEWACQNFNNGPQCNQDQINSFVSEATKWAESTSWVKATFPFGMMKDMVNVNPENAMMDQSGKITALGKEYLNA